MPNHITHHHRVTKQCICLGDTPLADQGADTGTADARTLGLFQWDSPYYDAVLLAILFQEGYISLPVMSQTKICSHHHCFDGKTLTKPTQKFSGAHSGHGWRKVNDDVVGDASVTLCQSQFLF